MVKVHGVVMSKGRKRKLVGTPVANDYPTVTMMLRTANPRRPAWSVLRTELRCWREL